MGRWDEDDFYVGRITALFAELPTEEKELLCKVAEQMIVNNENKDNCNVKE